MKKNIDSKIDSNGIASNITPNNIAPPKIPKRTLKTKNIINTLFIPLYQFYDYNLSPNSCFYLFQTDDKIIN